MSVTRRSFVLGAAAAGALAADASAGWSGPATASELSPGVKQAAQHLPASLRTALLAKMAAMRTPGAIVLVDVPGEGTWAGLGTDNPARTRQPIQADDTGSRRRTLLAQSRSWKLVSGQARLSQDRRQRAALHYAVPRDDGHAPSRFRYTA